MKALAYKILMDIGLVVHSPRLADWAEIGMLLAIAEAKLKARRKP